MASTPTYHPRPDENGKPLLLRKPSIATPVEYWTDSASAASVLPGGPMPGALNGVPFASWDDVPRSDAEWDRVTGQTDIDEPVYQCPSGKQVAAGVAVMEADGRVWLVSPSNEYAGYRNTFPKGRVEGAKLQAAAIREAFEESGLKVEITGYLADSMRSLTYTRYYIARRVGGTPADMGWESQAVHLVPVAELGAFLHHKNDEVLKLAIEKHFK